MSLALEDRELKDFAHAMGFKIGSYVLSLIDNSKWKVRWITSCSGLLRLDDITIALDDGRGIARGSWKHLYSRTARVYYLHEGNYFDNYIPIKNKKAANIIQLSLFR
jgi:hypothetical protein